MVLLSTVAGAAGFVLDLSGEWRVAGTNFEGRIRLPGTLADAASEEFNPRWKVSPKWFTGVFLANGDHKEKAVKLDDDTKDMMNN